MVLAIALILAAAASRMLAFSYPEFANFSPMMALAFCGAVYLKRPVAYLVPMAALAASDLYLNHRYGVELLSWGMLPKYLCFGAAYGIGHLVARRRSWGRLLSGAIAGSLLFYVATNTFSWVGAPVYAQSLSGWVQALTVGQPGLPPTWTFFRHSFASDLLFTGLFAAVFEFAALRVGADSLLGRRPGVEA